MSRDRTSIAATCPAAAAQCSGMNPVLSFSTVDRLYSLIKSKHASAAAFPTSFALASICNAVLPDLSLALAFAPAFTSARAIRFSRSNASWEWHCAIPYLNSAWNGVKPQLCASIPLSRVLNDAEYVVVFAARRSVTRHCSCSCSHTRCRGNRPSRSGVSNGALCSSNRRINSLYPVKQVSACAMEERNDFNSTNLRRPMGRELTATYSVHLCLFLFEQSTN